MSSKNFDAVPNSPKLALQDRKTLLQARLAGNDAADSINNGNSNTNSIIDPTDSQTHVPIERSPSVSVEARSYTPRTISVPASLISSNSLPIGDYTPVDSSKLTEELHKRIEEERQIKEDVENKFKLMQNIALDFIKKYVDAKQELDDIHLYHKEQKLGSITTSLTGSREWVGGLEVKKCEKKIKHLQKLSDDINNRKKTDKDKGIDLRCLKFSIKSDMKEQTNIMKQLNEEREIYINELRAQYDVQHSHFYTGQLLDEGNYSLMQYIGRGGFSEVWQALDLEKCEVVAIKIQNLDPQWPASKKDDFIRHTGREIKIFMNTKHINVVTYYKHFYIGDNTVALVMEYCGGGDLSQMIRKRGKIPENVAKHILYQVVQGLLALKPAANESVIHYDLKPGNILFDSNHFVKITDFGLSKIVEEGEEKVELTSQGTGTYYYAAPETFDRSPKNYITSAVDTWSLGIIFYEMLYGKRPFGQQSTQQQFAQSAQTIFEKPPEFPSTAKISKSAQSFIITCLTKDARNRPTLEQIAQHEFWANP